MARLEMRAVVKEILSTDKKRMVTVFLRDDGTFGFECLRFGEDLFEQFWFPYGRFSECFALTADMAEREARARVDWLREESEDA